MNVIEPVAGAVDAAGAARELAGAIQQLFPERLERRLDELVRKQAQGALTEAEKIELKGFLTKTQAGIDGPRHRT